MQPNKNKDPFAGPTSGSFEDIIVAIFVYTES